MQGGGGDRMGLPGFHATRHLLLRGEGEGEKGTQGGSYFGLWYPEREPIRGDFLLRRKEGKKRGTRK